ncbi:UDP-glucose 4-epimerase [Methanophagales archaeon]|nr:UDP-glucose 4-epimerase [Methanophagales archaeon]
MDLKRDFSKALVTGGAGFIGSHIVEELLKQGIKVVSVDNLLAGKLENVALFLDNRDFEFVCCDITNYNELEPNFKDVDVVFHNAASKKTICMRDPMRDLSINAEGTFNVLAASRKYKVKKFIHASTGSVYGEPIYFPTTEEHPVNPTSFYGVSKLAGEKYVKLAETLYDMKVTILRYHHVYGPRQEYSDVGGVIPIFIRRLLYEQPPIIHGDGTQLRSFTYVKDVVAANFLVAAKEESNGEVYNLASGIKVTINELANKLMDIMGKRYDPIYDDWMTGDILKFDIDNTKLKELGFEFQFGFDDGLKSTIGWLEKLLSRGDDDI